MIIKRIGQNRENSEDHSPEDLKVLYILIKLFISKLQTLANGHQELKSDPFTTSREYNKYYNKTSYNYEGRPTLLSKDRPLGDLLAYN